MNKLISCFIACIISGSFTLAVHDSSFRNEFGKIASTGFTAISELTKPEKAEKDKQKRKHK